jgi:hypothetical protein
MGVAQKRDFYNIDYLNEEEIKVVRAIAIDPSKNPLVREMNEGWLDFFKFPYEFGDKLKKQFPNMDSLHNLLEVQPHNLGEELQGHIEKDGARFLESLLKQDANFYLNEEDRMSFMLYLSVQYMRTLKIESNLLEMTKKLSKINVKKIWPVLRIIYSTNIGWSLSADPKRFKLVFLKNESDLNFVTADQPVINTYAAKSPNIEVEKLEMYYPLSPSLALLITDKKSHQNQTSIKELSIDEVNQFNKLIIDYSHEQVFSNDKETLQIYVREAIIL